METNNLPDGLENTGSQYKNPPAGDGCYWVHQYGQLRLMKDGRVLSIFYFDEKKVPAQGHVPKPD